MSALNLCTLSIVRVQ